MKLHQNSTPVLVNGGEDQSSFSIALNGKAFRVLSDTLYQNKIGSIVREVSTNAYDAHVMAGNPEVPFQIHLPDAFEPWFSVKDFGVGLSSEDIRSVFTVYFQSTKDNSNNTVGAFGLGAKTPFSYTDQFTVTSVKNGKRTIYSAFITESGIPNIIEMHSEETSEPNGVEIKLSVKREDYNNFKTEVQSQLKFFKVKPEIINGDVVWGSHIEIPEYTSSSVEISKKKNNWQQPCWIVQGNVGYPLSFGNIRSKISTDNLSLIDTVLSQCDSILHFEIGQIGVTASREGVEYDDATVKNIDAKLTIVRKELEMFVKQELSSKQNDWERACSLNSNNLLKYLYGTNKLGNFDTKANHNVSISLHSIFNEVQKDVDVGNGVLRDMNIRKYELFSRSHYTKKAGNYSAHAVITLTSSGKLVIIFQDKTSFKNMKRDFLCEKLLKEGYSIYLVEEVNAGITKELKEQISDYMGGFDNFYFLSEVELPKEEKEKRKKSTIATHYKLSKAFDYNLHSWTKLYSELKDQKETVVYVECEKMDFVNSKAPSQIAEYCKSLSFVKDSPELVAVRSKDIGKLNSNFIKLEDYLENLKQSFDISKMKKRYARFLRYSAMDYRDKYFASAFADTLKQYAKDAKITKIVEIYEKIKSDCDIQQSDIDVLRFVGYTPSNPALFVKKVTKLKAENTFLNLAVEQNEQVRRTMSGKDIARCLVG